VNARCPELPRTVSSRNWGSRLSALLSLVVAVACGNGATQTTRDPATPPKPDAPLVDANPGAWFDAHGNLTVVGPGKRLRLVLSGPIAACGPELPLRAVSPELVARSSLPFHVVGEACRETHPTILLPEEGDTASPAELEHSYHEVVRCGASDFGLTDGWVPKLVEASDPCPLALGLGWRLPAVEELVGLTIDDRKAVAGALFDPEDRSSGGALLLYARSKGGELVLSTLSPNAADRPPVLDASQREKPLFGVGLRCVHDGALAGLRATPPVLPHAAACLREKRGAAGRLTVGPGPKASPEVQALKRWLEAVERAPENARDQRQLAALSELLASPSLERIASQARDERALTERYADLAESLDDPSVPQSERDRRHAEFEHLRRRLGDQIVSSSESAGSDHTALPALLSRLLVVVEAAADAKPQPSKPQKKPRVDYTPVLTRLRALSGKLSP